MQAMILAAGLGTRLKPYSLVRPKPLFPVLNRPLLLATIDRLQNNGFSTILVNAHHLKEQISDALAGITGVIVQEEKEIIGTGGGLRLALRSLSDEPVLVTNGDIYHSVDYSQIYRRHLEKESALTMVLHNYPRFNTVSVSGNKITGFGKVGENKLAYTGLQVINPDVLASIPENQYFCIINHYRNLLKKNIDIYGLVLEETNWSDMGTPDDYLALHEALLTGEMPVWPELLESDFSSVVVDNRAIMEEGSSVEEWGCIGNARIGARALIKRSIVWDGSAVAPDTRLSDCIVVPEKQ